MCTREKKGFLNKITYCISSRVKIVICNNRLAFFQIGRENNMKCRVERVKYVLSYAPFNF